jgi:hypothetical protein
MGLSPESIAKLAEQSRRHEAELAEQDSRHATELAEQDSRHATELAEKIWCAVYHQGDTVEDISDLIGVPVARVCELRDLHGPAPA